MPHTTRTNIEISDSFSSLTEKIANIEIQMPVFRDENEDLKNTMAILHRRIKDLESASAKLSTPWSYSAVAVRLCIECADLFFTCFYGFF
jgi:hypothetical protein